MLKRGGIKEMKMNVRRLEKKKKERKKEEIENQKEKKLKWEK